MFRSFVFVLSLSILAFSLFGKPASADEVRFGNLMPFTTDGCSHFPNGTSENPNQWLHCCVQHDFKYWAGGGYFERIQADLDLRNCVAATGEPEIGDIMYAGVRVGGSPFYPTPFRWGYGWPVVRGYAHLAEEERQQVIALTPEDLSKVPITNHRDF